MKQPRRFCISIVVASLLAAMLVACDGTDSATNPHGSESGKSSNSQSDLWPTELSSSSLSLIDLIGRSSSSQSISSSSHLPQSSSYNPVIQSSSSSIKVPESSPSAYVSSSSSYTKLSSAYHRDSYFIWNSRDGIDYALIEFEETFYNTEAYWYDFSDSIEHTSGKSTIHWPVGLDYYGSLFSLLIREYHSITGTTELREGYPDPYAGLELYLYNDNNSMLGLDVTTWRGFCIVYESSSPFILELVAAQSPDSASYYYELKQGNKYYHGIEWLDFKPTNAMAPAITEIIQNLRKVRLKFTQSISGSETTFSISQFGSNGKCSTYD